MPTFTLSLLSFGIKIKLKKKKSKATEQYSMHALLKKKKSHLIFIILMSPIYSTFFYFI
jgi:hypothetical protein